MTVRFLALAPLPLLALAACTADPATVETRSAAAIAKAPAATVLGPGKSCINRSQVRNTVVRSDQVIDFEMQGGAVYRNTLQTTCPGLGFERAITYETSIDQLCRPQIIYVLQNFGGNLQRGAGCSLGDFVPVRYEKAAAR
ncbi:MAG: hypothetical protein ACKO01_11060 [Erythrobacter sp.]